MEREEPKKEGRNGRREGEKRRERGWQERRERGIREDKKKII